MKNELEPQEIEAIAQRVAEILRPILGRNSKTETENMIFDLPALAEYLKVSTKWIYERTHLKEIPYIKIGGQLRFNRKEIDKWLQAGKIPAAETPDRILKTMK